ncbi:ATP-dependent DNA helicase, partial [Wolfiporia cocos MD-104 SS10]
MPSTVYSWDNIDLDDEHLCEGTAASLADYRSIQSGRSAATGPSKATGGELLRSGSNDLQTRLDSAVAEIESFEAEIERQRAALAELSSCRDALIEEVENLRAQLSAAAATGISQRQSMASKGKSRAITLSDYTTSFEWTDTLKAKMRSIFKIQNFRLCQEGVCNANLDGRDIVCVMPTGGGKSLTYQLPALISPGCTLVISPLISLMTDQILHLRDAGVEAVMITGSTPKEQSREIRDRLTAMARRQGSSGPDIKLLYVTPEKIAKDKSLLPLLEKLDHAKALARLVIDEAHCVSEMGHDYRPDYQKLSVLRKLFPNIPILALSATCPPRVLEDLLNILQMQQPLQKPTSAANHGTIHFQAPLYRKNLHYTIVRKPSSHADHIKAMKEYILEHHEDQSGIIYCLSKKDAETVAQDLEVTSDHRIKTGVYHADIGDSRKEALHKQWRRGAVKVICATIAFGLGIDKGDVRFVIHHSIPKSVEGFYQESGRAGRDGKDADCVLYYRPQDATRLTQLTVGERGASEKLHDMLRFVQNMEECRKVQFAKYFRASSQLEIASWTTDEEDALARCGHCDNCTRAPDALVRQDVRVPAWQILQVARAVQRNDGRVTIATLSDLVRGLGNATINVASGKRKGRAKESETIGLDLDAIAGGKVNLSKGTRSGSVCT